jgi:isoquinoline 1-oxidoreductase beta subunit
MATSRVAAMMPVPASNQVRLKDRKDWRYIGKPHVVDLKDIVRGRATYGIDDAPGMKYASVERCPVYGEGQILRRQDAVGARSVERGVEDPATPMPSGFKPLGGIAVVPATPGRRNGAGNTSRSVGYRENAGTTALPTAPNSSDGQSRAKSCATTAMSTVHSRQPPGAYPSTILFRIWHMPRWRCQCRGIGRAIPARPGADIDPTQVRQTVLGINEADVTVNVTLLGGGFVQSSRTTSPKPPCCRAWSARRSGDVDPRGRIQHDYYHAICAQHLEAALGKTATRCVAAPPSSGDRSDIPAGYRLRQRRRAGAGVVDMPHDIPMCAARTALRPTM